MNTELLEKILLYIDVHIHEKISLVELAEVAGYSPFYFSKLFAEIMGMPVIVPKSISCCCKMGV